MKKILFLLICLFTLSGATDTYAQKAKKEKKEKKEFVWNWDGEKSGDDVVDNYLDKITALWQKMDTYEAQFGAYTYIEDTLQINGKYYILAHMEDADKNVVTRGMVNWLFVQSITSSTSIILDATNATSLTATATLALPGLGLKAVKFGKYLKGGPLVIGKGVKEIGAISKQRKQNARSWKSLKNGAVDPATLNYFNAEALQIMKRCYYVKEIVTTDPSYTVVEQYLKDKTPEEIEADANRLSQEIAQQTVLPEDASKSLDDLSDDVFEQELNS